MNGWKSHLPEMMRLEKLSGFGLNAIEMRKNEGLSDWVVQDLNENPVLPYKNESYSIPNLCDEEVQSIKK